METKTRGSCFSLSELTNEAEAGLSSAHGRPSKTRILSSQHHDAVGTHFRAPAKNGTK